MGFGFDTVYERRGTGCGKWDYIPFPDTPADSIAMWVADMDFAVAPGIVSAIEKRMEHPILGYYKLDDTFYSAIIDWQKRRYGVTGLNAEHITYHNGVIGALTSAIDAFSKPGDPILVEAPGYPNFGKTIAHTGRVAAVNRLVETGAGYAFDFEATEALIREKNIRLSIFCNPHNPTGRCWNREEIAAYVDICRRNGVTVIADEIWSDVIIDAGKPFVPFFSVGDAAKEIGVATYSPTKGFNIAGLVTSYSVIHNDALREKVNETAAYTHYNSPSALSIAATVGAYTDGDAWLDACMAYIGENMDDALRFLRDRLPKITARKPAGTYLLWLDFSATGLSHEEILRRCIYKAGVIMNDGATFIAQGEKHMRMNLATPRIYVQKAMERLYKAFEDVAR
jgi:cystathionine beta-lyase